MSDGTPTLISMRAFANQSLELLWEALENLKNFVQVEKSSSVYKVKVSNPNRQGVHDLRHRRGLEGLAVVILGRTNLSADQLLFRIQSCEQTVDPGSVRRSLSINLLTYGDQALMTPQLTLPHPELHHRPEELIPAAEVWGDYLHPVLEAPLHELAKKHSDQEWGEFFAQGHRLLDFSSSDA